MRPQLLRRTSRDSQGHPRELDLERKPPGTFSKGTTFALLTQKL